MTIYQPVYHPAAKMIQDRTHLSRRKLMDLRFRVKKNNETGAECFIQKLLSEDWSLNTIGGNPHVTSTAKTARVEG